MPRRAAPVVIVLALALGCGGSSTPSDASTSAGPSSSSSCVASCAGKQCGSDGCGGGCGTCASGSTCSTQGTCQVNAAPVATSPNCPAGQRCAYEIHVAYHFSCYGENCVQGTEIASFGESFGESWYCKTLGCQGGESTCGTQYNLDNDVGCRACQVACQQPAGVEYCANETNDGRCRLTETVWPYVDYLVPCTCR